MSEDYLAHIGKGHLDGGHSGRYPWGSGENPYQHESWFLNRVKQLKNEGMTESEIVEAIGPEAKEVMGIDVTSVSQLRARKSIETHELRAARSSTAYRLKEKGLSNVEIGKMMGLNESSVRNLLDPHLKVKNDILDSTAKMLKENVDKKGFIDVGSGTEIQLGISRQRLKTAIAVLKEQGYNVYYIAEHQINQPIGQNTSIMVLAPPGTEWKDVNKNKDKIHLIKEYSEDGGLTWLNIEAPQSVSSKRVEVSYAEDGGKEKDGLIELRRGVPDISLNQAKYAQVRIAVDGTHYLKGMAVYSDDLPEGIDIRFNTNKHKGTPMLGEKDNSVLKPLKDDPDNPFGSTIKQRHYIDSDGKEKLSAINIVSEEGAWEDWSKRFSSQFLSKQEPSFAKKQLDIKYKEKLQEYEEIENLTNPSVKKRLLDSFADDCDSSAVKLYAAALPRTANHVIIPFPEIKDNEVYAPNFNDGERVVLVRHPHAGRFEIPELIVNNKYSKAKKTLGQAPDAIGINSKVAEKLSGADFDGDTVLVIPNNKGQVKTSKSLKDLENFDPKEAYPAYEGMPRMSKKTKELEMGKISNLITDMTLHNAPPAELARAVKHSMVVIDAEKHNLNYKQSAKDNRIAELKEKYQGGKTKGASTLISLASSEKDVPKRKDTHKIDEEGRKIYEETGETYVNKSGKTVIRTQKSTHMAEAKDAYELSSGTVMENVYADHANKLKALANKSRKEARELKGLEYSPSANKAYKKEVESLDSKLRLAEANSPYERRALILANQTLYAKKKANPDMTKEEAKKIGAQAMAAARTKVGAHKEVIGSDKTPLTEREWEAIQSGAITPTKLERILNNSNLDVIKKYATPRTTKLMTPAKVSRAKSMLAAGYTQAEVADALGVSVSTLKNNI